MPDPSRRRLLSAAAASGLALMTNASSAAALLATPRQSRGPFYPVEIPLDHDNDLVTVAGRAGIARGEIVNVVGQVRDSAGRPLAGIEVDIWQCDNNGRYHHPGDRRNVVEDPNFQGYGRFVTAADGQYRFRTIKPVAYPGRAPHIHFALKGAGVAPLVTQMYVAGAPENQRDGLLNGIRDKRARESLIVAFDAMIGTEPLARFDIVMAS